MYSTNETLLSKFNSPVRSITARVELYEGSTLVNTFAHNGALISWHIDRAGEEGKFFGFGICQKLNVKLLDLKRQLNISTANSFRVIIEDIAPFPVFYITEVNRDENTNELSITAYEALKDAATCFVGELDFGATLDESVGIQPYTIAQFVEACASRLGLTAAYVGLEGDLSFGTSYEKGANFEGTETIRDALTAAAEATQTIFYVSYETLVFKRLDKDGDEVLSIDKSQYFELNSKTNRRLSAICSVTELGDNVEKRLDETGTTQYIRDNPFYANRDDIDLLLENAMGALGGFVLNQFECSWRGNPLLEIGDKIALTTKDNDIVKSYVLNDTISYDGALAQKTSWNFGDNEGETAATPTSVGEALKKTFAKVDKINKKVQLVASDNENNKEAIGQIQINTDSVISSVKSMEEIIQEGFESVNGEIQTLTNEVSTKISKDDIVFEIEKVLEQGIDKVTTTTGYTFNENGLTVSKTDSEISTQITQDGMTVSRSGEKVLTVNNEGVKAEDLHATSYLIIGKNSRFEDYGNRTGCFWIG